MSSATSTSSILSIPRSAPASSNAAIRLLAQVYLSGQSLEITEADGSELSLTTGPSGPNFQAAFSTLLESAGQSSQALGKSENKQDVERWIAAATDVTKEALDKKELDQFLQNKTYIAGGQLTAADVAVCGSLAGYMAQAQASHEDRLSHPSVTRHFDLVQNTASVVGAITKLSPNTIAHAPVQIDLDNVPVVERKYESSKKDKKAEKEKAEKAAVKEAAGAAVESDLGLAKGSIAEADADKKEGRAGKKEKKAKAAAAEGAAGEGKAAGKKEKGSGGGGKGGAVPAEPEVITPGLIDLRVGRIVEVKKHPDADSLYVEQIDIGEAEPRTVVSGLVNYIPIEEMQGKMLIAVCNLKPASMRGIKSFAMVLAATSPDGKEGMGSVELVAPPEGSGPGDRVYFEGFDSVTALEQLPPKKKIFETIQPGFTTLETREAAWIDPTDKSKVAKIRTEKGYCKAPNFVGASLS